MNDYIQRSEISPVDRTAPRPVVPVTPARSIVEAAPQATTALPAPFDLREGADIAAGSEEQLATAAEYARTQAQVADIIASIRAAGSSLQAVDSATITLNALTPTPIVIVPLPASRDMLEQTARVARQLLANAALARAAQSNVQPGTVDNILSQFA